MVLIKIFNTNMQNHWSLSLYINNKQYRKKIKKVTQLVMTRKNIKLSIIPKHQKGYIEKKQTHTHTHIYLCEIKVTWKTFYVQMHYKINLEFFSTFTMDEYYWSHLNMLYHVRLHQLFNGKNYIISIFAFIFALLQTYSRCWFCDCSNDIDHSIKNKNTAGILLAEFRKAAEMPLFINLLTEYRPF